MVYLEGTVIVLEVSVDAEAAKNDLHLQTSPLYRPMSTPKETSFGKSFCTTGSSVGGIDICSSLSLPFPFPSLPYIYLSPSYPFHIDTAFSGSLFFPNWLVGIAAPSPDNEREREIGSSGATVHSLFFFPLPYSLQFPIFVPPSFPQFPPFSLGALHVGRRVSYNLNPYGTTQP